MLGMVISGFLTQFMGWQSPFYFYGKLHTRDFYFYQMKAKMTKEIVNDKNRQSFYDFFLILTVFFHGLLFFFNVIAAKP